MVPYHIYFGRTTDGTGTMDSLTKPNSRWPGGNTIHAVVSFTVDRPIQQVTNVKQNPAQSICNLCEQKNEKIPVTSERSGEFQAIFFGS